MVVTLHGSRPEQARQMDAKPLLWIFFVSCNAKLIRSVAAEGDIEVGKRLIVAHGNNVREIHVRVL
jgi:hypothetical protein